MNTAPRNGQKLLLLVGDNEWCTVGYFDKKLGWVAEKKNGNAESENRQARAERLGTAPKCCLSRRRFPSA